MNKAKKLINFTLSLPKKAVLLLIIIYQKTISPDHGLFKSRFPNGYCRFYPSCSQYGHDAIKKRGLVVGSLLSGWRLLRCNPWSKGGVDQLK